MNQKGFTAIWLIIGALLLIVLFAPIPYIYPSSVYCLPCIDTDSGKCPRCPSKGDFVWQPSLAQQFLNRLRIPVREEEMTVPVDPIINWKTFETDSFSIKYPNGWQPFSQKDDPGLWGISLRNQTGELIGALRVYTGNKLKITLPIIDWIKKENEEVDEAVKKGVRGSTGVGKIVIDENKDVTVGGEKAVITSRAMARDETITYYIVHNDKVFTFETDLIYSIPDADREKIKGIYNQILSTFRFPE